MKSQYNGRKLKKVLAIVLSILLTGLCMVQSVFADNSSQPSKSTNSSKRVIRVGYYSYPGFQEYDEKTEQYSGYGYEYLIALSQYANWEFEFVPCTFSDGVKMLEAGQLDLMNNVSVTDERKEYLAYSSSSSGSNCAYLAMKADDDSVAYEDYDSFDKLTVGLVKTSINSERFVEFCKENECSPSLIYYETQDEAKAALENGDIDARIITSSQNIDMHVIAKFAPEEYYFAVPKGKTDLLKELNQAMNTLKTNDPEFEVRLDKKYYGNIVDDDTVLTDKEKEFIKENPTVSVAYDENCYPLSYTDDNGKFAGTIAEIYEKISEATGLKFDFNAYHAGDLHKIHKGNEAMIYAELPYSYIWTSGYDVNLTPPFYDITVMEVRDNDFTGIKGTMAVVKGYYLTEQCKSNYGDNYEYVEYDNTESCIEAVRKGDADITCMTSFEADAYQAKSKYKGLVYSVSQRLNYSLSVGVSKNAEPELFSIMMKGLNATSDDEIDAIFRETSLNTSNPDLISLLMENPEVAFPIILILGFLVAAIVFFYIHSRSEKKQNQVMNTKNMQLADAVAQADKASTAKSQFLSQMSHEIRTPMNAIVGLTSLARQHENEPDKINEYLGKIETSSKVLLSIINDVLDMSAIESEKLKIDHAEFNLNSIFDEISTIYTPQCEGKGIVLKMDVKINHPSLIGDSLRVNQVLLNLISNAYKFTDKGGTISITAKEKSTVDETAFYQFTVSDTGIGMSAAMLERLFKPFEQESAGTARTHGGSGLGLSIAKNLVDMMHGAITVESEKGKGTTFVVDLPFNISKSPASETDLEAVDMDKLDFTGKKILLAEDNDLNAEIASEILDIVGLEVDRACNGKEAVDMFCQADADTYALILMDVQMPVMDGYEAAKAIRALDREDGKPIPIYAMTANAFNEDISLAMSAGMNGHIAKPIDTNVLYATLAKELN